MFTEGNNYATAIMMYTIWLRTKEGDKNVIPRNTEEFHDFAMNVRDVSQQSQWDGEHLPSFPKTILFCVHNFTTIAVVIV